MIFDVNNCTEQDKKTFLTFGNQDMKDIRFILMTENIV